jgi:hypothetical protein
MTDFHIEGINTNNLLLFKDNNYNILKEDSQKVFTVFSQGQDLFAFKMDSNYVIESFTAFREPIVKNNGTNWTITFK